MSDSCKFPINIDTAVKAENCNMYCDYKYEYNDSSCVVYNTGTCLKINYDLKSDGTVVAFGDSRYPPSGNSSIGLTSIVNIFSYAGALFALKSNSFMLYLFFFNLLAFLTFLFIQIICS